MNKAVRIRVYGKVQNVGYRYYTVKTAMQFRIMGFVKNEPSGTVYIEAEGESLNLDTFIDWCHQGPNWAQVERLEVQEIPVTGYMDFSIR